MSVGKVRCLLLVLAVCGIIFGLSRGEMQLIFHKAVRVCMECIGLG